MTKFWQFFLEKKSFTYLVMIALVLTGMFSVFVIPKESAPEVIVPIGIVATTLRGGSSEDVEKLITKKIEQEVINIENIDKVTSNSSDGLSVISAQFLASADVDKSIADLKEAVDKVKGELPDDASEPNVSKVNFADQPVLILSVSKNATDKELTELAENLDETLSKVKGVSKVEVSGIREKQVQVVLKKEELVKYGVSPDEVVRALGVSNVSIPVGKVELNQIEYPIKFQGSIEEGKDVSDISFRTKTGALVYLRDIALVEDGLEDPKTYSRISEAGKPSEKALTLLVYKKSGGDVTVVTRDVKAKIEDLKKDVLNESSVVVSIDAGKDVSRDLKDLSRTGLETVVLVMLVLLVTIGWRESLVAGLSIPLSFVIAFIGLYFSGNTINFLSLFSLILAIGILVDSGIVVAESIHTRNKDGNVHKAAIDTLKEYAWPLVAGTMTTIAVFAPLFFLSGIVGQFIKSIPFTIIFVLLASIFVALGMVPIIATLLDKKEVKKSKLEKMQEEYFHKAQNWYKKYLSELLLDTKKQKRFYYALVGMFIASFALVFAGLIKVELFPQEDIGFIVVSIEELEGTALTKTDLVTRQVEEILYANKDVKSFVTTVGASSALIDDTGGGENSKYANITIILSDKDERDLTSTDILENLRKELSVIQGTQIKIAQPSSGPPSGKPIAIKLKGDDLDELSIYANEVENLLKNIEGTLDVETSLRGDGSQFTIEIDKNKAALYGVTPLEVASLLRTALSGSEATEINTNNNDIKVLVRVGLNANFKNPEDSKKTDIESLRNLQINTPEGSILLSQIVDIKLTESRSVIKREDQKRIATIYSDVREGSTALEITNKLKARESELKLPESIQIIYGGETEDVDNTFRDMLIALAAGMILMLAILVLEFNSFRYSFYLLSAVPLSLIGVLFGLFFTRQALSFSSMLGIVALAGVIINHAIILLDSIIHRLDKEALKEGEDVLLTAIVESSAIRLRPIVLTTLTTVVGMIPLAFVSALWGPLAITIMFGLLFSMVLTLVFIPLRFYRKPGKRYAGLK